MSENAVRWFEIYVQDIARASAFYETVLGVRLARIEGPDIEMWGFPGDPGRPGASGSLVRIPGMPSGGCSTLVYFGCEDCAIEEARVVPAGGRVERSKLSIGQYGFVTLAFDTEGNLFGLHSMR
jgi:uncharacterized protein